MEKRSKIADNASPICLTSDNMLIFIDIRNEFTGIGYLRIWSWMILYRMNVLQWKCGNISKCHIPEGNVLDLNQLKKSITGQDIVYPNLATDLEAMAKNMVRAMNYHLRRLSVLHSQFPLTIPTWISREVWCRIGCNLQIRAHDNRWNKRCSAIKHPDSIVTGIII